MSKDSGPIAVLLAEHQQSRHLVQMMRHSIGQYQGGNTRARDTIVQNAASYIRLMRLHIYKEDSSLFPLANKSIAPLGGDQIVQVFEQFEQMDDGELAHERFFSLAARLETEWTR